MPADYAFLAEDIVSGQVKTPDGFSLSGWSCGETLNRPGQLGASMGITDPNCTEEILSPWKTAIYLLRDGAVEWGGILKPPSRQLGANALGIECTGWPGYWDLQEIRWYDESNPYGRTFSATEQFEIFQTLINDAQDETVFGSGFDLGITVAWVSPSGQPRDRTDDYRTWQSKNLGEALRQLAAVENGFDFSMRYTLNTATDRIDKEMVLHYPRKGRDTGFVFAYDRVGRGGNVVDYGFADVVNFAWVGDGWGSGADETRLKSSYVDETLRGVYPPYTASPAFTSVEDPDTLAANTAAWFRTRNRPRLTPVLRVDPDRYPRWGDWATGDTVQVRINDTFTDPTTGVTRKVYGSTGNSGPQTNRVTGWNIGDSGETHDVILADPDLELSA